jgi:hypothetical protein
MGGLHNVENATAAIAIALCLGIEDEKIIAAVADFKGVKRRFEYKVNTANKVLIADYAHHPEELSALISGVKSIFPNQKMVRRRLGKEIPARETSLPFNGSKKAVENPAACIIQRVSIADQKLNSAAVNDQQCRCSQASDVFL